MHRSTTGRVLAVVACTGGLLLSAATAASAGEIKGNGGYITGVNSPLHGRSICAYSGQNDAYHDPSQADPRDPTDVLHRVQSFGQIVRAVGPIGGVPGTECNPNKSSGEG